MRNFGILDRESSRAGIRAYSACPAHLDGVHQVLHQEQAPDFCDGLVEFGQNHVAVLMDHVLGQGHLLVEVLPERQRQSTFTSIRIDYAWTIKSTWEPFGPRVGFTFLGDSLERVPFIRLLDGLQDAFVYPEADGDGQQGQADVRDDAHDAARHQGQQQQEGGAKHHARCLHITPVHKIHHCK